MKKLFFYLSVAMLAVAAVSCQKEMVVADGENGNVTLTIQTPEVAATKAIADGMNVDIVYYEIYKAEAGHKNSLSGKPLIKSTVPMDAKGASLTLNLLQGQEYVGLFWAQVNGKNYYNVGDLRNVTVNYPNEDNNKTLANDEDRAAFCNYKTFATGQNVTVVLERPFAQINLGTSFQSLDIDYEIALEESSMTVTGVANAFNVAAMTAKTETENIVNVEFGMNTVPYAFEEPETLSANDDTWAYAGMNYVLVPNDAATVDVTYSIKTDVGTVTRQVPTVPVQKNHRTNLLGNLLTQETAIEIIVDEKFNTPDLEPDPIYMAAAMGGEFTLTEDIALTEPLIIQSSLVLDLNGHTLTGGKPDSAEMTGSDISAIVVENGATLTIVGDGNIVGTEYGVYVKNGNVVVKGGDIKAGTSAVQVYNGTANIEGGKFSATSSNVYVINCIDANWKNGTAKVSITGGTFVGFNPAANAAEGAGTNFVAEGYKAVEKSGAWHVVADETDVVVLTTADLTAALTAAVTAGNTSVVLDANGAEFDMNGAITKANVPAGTTVTIRNANINARSYGNKLEGTVIYENCTFNNANGAYSIHFDGGNGHVVFKNCDLYGWNSFGKIGSVTFENCTLAGNGTYALIRSYTTMTLTDCSIDASNANHTDEYSEGVEAVEGGTMTMENISYVVYDDNSLQFALENAGVNTIYLNPREEAYIADIYNGTAARESLTIIGSEGTKFGHTATTGGQLRLELFDRFTISNCEIIQRSGVKTWGHLVFSKSGKENGVYTIKNCTFNSNGNQGIYINETTSGAVYNIENCTFNGDFGSADGAVTIQNNPGAVFTVNVNGCTFNTNSNHICYLYADPVFELNTDPTVTPVCLNR